MKQTSLNLHDLLHHTSYNHAVICTYTFDPNFFENYCLENFNSLKANGNITVITDHETYVQAITGPEENKPKQANLRYLLHPISVPGRFHAKIFLFVSRNKGRLILGSANFTKPGITSNAEMINYYDYESEKNEEFLSLFQTVFIYLNEISNRWPSNALNSNLKSMEREASWLGSEAAIEQNPQITFLHNLERPLWGQIISHVAAPVDAVYILSRFFDAHTSLLDTVVKNLGPDRIKIYTQNGITTLTKNWLHHPLFKKRALDIFCCSYRDESYIQNLHAKAIAIKKGNRCLLAFGSANFTTPALLRDAAHGNVESILLINDLASKETQPAKLFDPSESAHRLKDDGTLQTATRQTYDRNMGTNKIVLRYAELVGNKIMVKVTITDDLDYDKLDARIQFQDEAYSRVALHHEHGEEYFTDPVESITRRLSETSSIMTIAASKGSKRVAESNPILVINLLDIQSGKHVRRERYIREAQQSAIDFFQVLENLIKEGDQEPLMTFFKYCDIPIMDVSRPFYARGLRPVWDGGKGMRHLGEGNLKVFHNLHEAAMNFYTRHFKKLQRHVKNGGINGIVNYLHIFLAMGGVLRSQVERLMQGFEACNKPIFYDEWYQYRTNLDSYFIKFKELMSCLHDEYLPNLLKIYTPEALRERFDPDLQPIKDLCTDMLAFHSRMEALLESNLKIETQNGQILPPPFYNDNVFLPANWVKYATAQECKIKKVLMKLAA
jgi:HKD family nuclease